MSVAPMHDEMVRPHPEEAERLHRLEYALDAIAESGTDALLTTPDGHPVPIPQSALDALRFLARGMARGLTMVLMPQGAELTTQQAAELLGVSRPFLISELLDKAKIPYHRVGAHRRLRIEDVLDFRERRASERRAHLAELTRLSQEAPGGYR